MTCWPCCCGRRPSIQPFPNLPCGPTCCSTDEGSMLQRARSARQADMEGNRDFNSSYLSEKSVERPEAYRGIQM
eukprot:3645560-Amphidinium_carterae.1